MLKNNNMLLRNVSFMLQNSVADKKQQSALIILNQREKK